MKKCYITSSPVPLSRAAEACNVLSLEGWDTIQMLPVGVVGTNKITGPNGQPQGEIAVMLFLTREWDPEKEDKPEYPSITLPPVLNE